MDIRVGTGCDTHKLVTGRSLIIGGVNIPYEKGLLGHSDADVLTHAVIDSILGAAGLSDIGTLFPDNDSKFKDISSLVLLKKVMDMITQLNAKIINVDTVVMAQKPKLMPYIKDIRQSLADTMNIEFARVNVKAKTGEGLGFVGREEGIFAQAVCLLSFD